MKLTWGSGSSPCIKVIIVMIEKGIWGKCESKLISFSKQEHKLEENLKINPRGQVPIFVDGNVEICESTAIALYLEHKYKDTNPLIPADLKEEALVYQRMFEVGNIQSKIILPILYYFYRTPAAEVDPKYMEEKVPAAHEELKRWDGYLEGKEFLVGEKFTMADIFFFSDLCQLTRQDLNLEKLYPNLHRYNKKLISRPSIVESAPPHWKEEASKCHLKDFDKYIK